MHFKFLLVAKALIVDYITLINQIYLYKLMAKKNGYCILITTQQLLIHHQFKIYIDSRRKKKKLDPLIPLSLILKNNMNYLNILMVIRFTLNQEIFYGNHHCFCRRRGLRHANAAADAASSHPPLDTLGAGGLCAAHHPPHQ